MVLVRVTSICKVLAYTEVGAGLAPRTDCDGNAAAFSWKIRGTQRLEHDGIFVSPRQ